jgi:hypothetical protein
LTFFAKLECETASSIKRWDAAVLFYVIGGGKSIRARSPVSPQKTLDNGWQL